MASQSETIRKKADEMRTALPPSTDPAEQSLQLLAIGVAEVTLLLLDRIATALEEANARK